MKQSAMEDPFEVLEVPVNADEETIRTAHRVKIRQCHPDVGGKVEEAARINWARDVLLDPVQRLDHVIRRARRTLGEDRDVFDRASTHTRTAYPSAASTPAEDWWQERQRSHENSAKDDPAGTGPFASPEATPRRVRHSQSPPETKPAGRSVASWWVTISIAAALSTSIVAAAATAWRSPFVMPHEWGVFVLAGLGWLVLAKAWWLSGRPPIAGQKSRGVATRVALSLVMLFAAASILIVADQSPFARSMVYHGWNSAPNGVSAENGVPTGLADRLTEPGRDDDGQKVRH